MRAFFRRRFLKKRKSLELRIAELESENAELKKENAELKSRLAKYEKKDSSNSSKPPSKDNDGKKKNKSSRAKSGKKPGAQKGHKGHAREQVSNPDKIEKCEVEKCLICGEDLTNIEGEVISKRQEIDITAPEPKTTEYQQVEKICPRCKARNKGEFPENIRAPVQIGNNTRALSIYLHVNHKVPFKRTTEIIADLLNLNISEGSIENFLEKAFKETSNIYPEIMNKLKSSEYIHSDETGIRVDKKLHQLWIWCNDKFTYYAADRRRSYAVIEEHLGNDFQGVAIHYSHSAQNKTAASKHQHCLVHYDRDLRYVIETENCKWAEAFYHLTLNARRIRDMIWSETYSSEARKKVIQSLHKALDQIMKIPAYKKEAYTLKNRVVKHRDKILTFLDYPDMPADNNTAERAIRNAKIHRKVSGCYRNPQAAQRYAVILSWIETAKRLGQSAILACQNIFAANFQFT